MPSLLASLLCTAVPALAISPGQLLFTSDYNGSVSTLQFNTCGSSATLQKIKSIQSCGGAPSWLSLNYDSRHLFCVDETVSPNGTLWSYAINDKEAKGELTIEASNVTSIPGPVNSGLYGMNPNASHWIALAEYGNASISTYALPLKSDSKALQTFQFKGSNVKASQAAAHPHQILRDPTNNFLVSPDLGADAVHVFKIDNASGKLTQCPDVKLAPGSGPRHVAWYDDGKTVQMFVANELSNAISSWIMTYPQCGCMAFKYVKQLFPYQAGSNLTRATPSEIRTKGNLLYVSTRNDTQFGGVNDSIATFSLKGNGDFALDMVSNSWGQGPRTFDISADGSYVAIGNQLSGNVAIITRDVHTGKLGNTTVANLQIVPPTKDTGLGLSSVIFDQE